MLSFFVSLLLAAPVTLPMGVADSAEVIITLAQGDIKLSCQDENLLVITGDPVPKITQLENDTVTRLALTAPEDALASWDLALTNVIPIDLNMEVGEGSTDLEFRGIMIRHFNYHLGSGTTVLRAFVDHDSWRDMHLRQDEGSVEVELEGLYSHLEVFDIFTDKAFVACSLMGTYPELEVVRIHTKSGDVAFNGGAHVLHDIEFDLQSESGSFAIELPPEVGILAYIDAPQKTIDPSFTLKHTPTGPAYVNSAYHKSPITLTVRLRSKTGAVALAARDNEQGT